MFFWVAVVVVLVVVAALVAWAMRGLPDRAHKPGTRHLD
jgi:hypothetical protein